MEEIFGGASSENGSERAATEMLRLELNEDRISALPDSLIHHILSFLPSTKQAIKTGVLSNRWQNQWTRVPVLIFDSTGNYDENFSHFIDSTLTLHDCSKIKKFHIQYDQYLGNASFNPHLTSKIRFATRKEVEELILHLSPLDEDVYKLPKFLFSNASLVKLELFKCYLNPNWIINWPRLKELKLECSSLYDSAIQNVVSGSPLLESLELTGDIRSPNVVIASESLKRLVFVDVECEVNIERIEISCPNLVELCSRLSDYSRFDHPQLPDQTIENALSCSPLLHTLELQACDCSERLVISSKSLKKLVLGDFHGTSDFEISCPNLEEVNLYGFMPRAIRAIYIFEFQSIRDFEFQSQSQRLAVKILRQLEHVNMLEIGRWFIKILSAWELGDWKLGNLFSPLLYCKCLTLNGTHFDEHFPGIVYAIRCSPVLEKLVIKFHPDQLGDLLDLNEYRRRKNNWNSYGTDFNCSVSSLKTVKIIGLSNRDDKLEFLFKLVEFILKNARMLDKIIVTVAVCGASVPFEVSKNLLSFQRCFPRTTIELLSSN